MLVQGLALLLAAAPLGAPHRAALPPAIRDTTEPVSWTIDVTHSELLFRVRHLVSRVTGTFTDWEGVITADPANLGAGSVQVKVRTGSISTNNERRDRHLRSDDFFGVERFPEMTFASTGVTIVGDEVTLAGTLTIKGISKPVVLTGRFLGMTPGAGGRDRMGFEVSTRINRLDYGLTWNRAAEGGGMVLADEVQIDIVVAAVKQVPRPPSQS